MSNKSRLVKTISWLLPAAIIFLSISGEKSRVESATIDIISTVAGVGIGGFTGDGGPATAARIRLPDRVAVDNAGNFYIGDTLNHRVRRVNAAGIINTLAGTGTAGYNGDGITATTAMLNNPRGIMTDSVGNLYIADSFNHRVRMVPAANGTYFGIAMTAGRIYTIAGNGTSGFSGDGGLSTIAQLSQPRDLAFDSAGNLLISDSNNRRVRMVPVADGNYFGIAMTANNIYTVAGNGADGTTGDGGAAISAPLGTTRGIVVDAVGSLLVVSYSSHRIRKVNSAGTISTIAGTTSGYAGDGGPATAARLNTPEGIALDGAGNLYVADSMNQRIRKIDTSGTITTVAGNGSTGSAGDGGPATAANLWLPTGVATAPGGKLYIADNTNCRVRLVEFNAAVLPVWAEGYPKAGVITLSSIEVLVRTDESGAAYFVALPAGSPAPSATQVKNGQNAAGTPVAANMKGSKALTADTEAGFAATDLSENTHYDFYVVAEATGTGGRLQPQPVKLSLLTAKVEWRDAESCQDCHGITEADFSPPPVDRGAVCEVCHRPEIFPLDGGGFHPAVPLSGSQLNSPPAVLHYEHRGYGLFPWPAGCNQCHGTVSCSVCHKNVGHGDHGSSQIPPVNMTTNNGITSGLESFSCGDSACHNVLGQPIQPGSCTNCHTVGKDGHTAEPRVHGDFSATTDACAGCHVAHSAPGAKLLQRATETDLCFVCHGSGAPASPFDVERGLSLNYHSNIWEPSSAGGFKEVGGVPVTSRHNVQGYGQLNSNDYDINLTGYLGIIPGGSYTLSGRGLTCSSCHQPHGGTGNVRLLRRDFASGATDRTVRATTGLNRIISYDQGFSEWCTACHGRFHKAAGSGSEGEDFGGVMTFRHAVNVSIDDPETVTNRTMSGTPLQTGKHLSDAEQRNTLACITCHRAHGTASEAVGFAATWRKDTDTADGKGGRGSVLLRMSNRGVCYNCHGAAERNLPPRE